MNKIKLLLNTLFVLLVVTGCFFQPKKEEIYLGTISKLYRKDDSNFAMKLINYHTYKFKMEITTTEGVIIKGFYKGKKYDFRPGDLVRVVIQDNRLKDVEVLDENQFNPLFIGVN